MGGAASRELEMAQSQVKRLTVEVQRARTSMQQKESAMGAMKMEIGRLSGFRDELDVTRRNLESTSAKLLRAKRDAHEVENLADQLATSRSVQTEQQRELLKYRQELEASKGELQRVFGELKFAQTESRHLERESAAREAELANARLVADACVALVDDADDETHPVFGTLLRDCGHKRLYRADPLTLWAGTLLWDEQRAFRADRAEMIGKAKLGSSIGGWPGCISVVEIEPAQRERNAVLGAVVDGQHRLGAAHWLSSQGKLTDVLQEIYVEVYPAMDHAHVKELFTEINRAEPVSVVDMPDVGATERENKIISDAAEAMRARYPAMFKASSRCKPPHLNKDVLRSLIFESALLEREARRAHGPRPHDAACSLTSVPQGLDSSTALCEWLEEANAALGARKKWAVSNASVKSSGALANALAKAREHGFFLGLSADWQHGKPA